MMYSCQSRYIFSTDDDKNNDVRISMPSACFMRKGRGQRCRVINFELVDVFDKNREDH